ncbi:xanthine dehydrogenase accessory factor [Caloramator quimbayensis]|uniref:Xanthine dehydrogenase accessory factor n=1 Tax=Caloramator quimbayensis TaxID=1147123 RepID=A0A1T4Y7J1_9CLOT|nr:XdhC/CoxI family protein [Caloramator quimbayensis]SKA97653.1 xanthine dehydrogenase accessory factor [Caloramator quimbayensis]
MEEIILERISCALKENKKAALITVVDSKGSSPGKAGFMMAVFEDKSTVGTVGGGELEREVIQRALKSISGGKDEFASFKLSDEGNLHMQCGGSIDVFIKVFGKKDRLLIAGGGHVAKSLYEIAKYFDFNIVIFEDREEFANSDRFPNCEIILGDIGENLKKYPIDERSYVVIVTRGHSFDEAALKASLNRGAAYVGMIGSSKKTNYIKERLLSEGFSKDELEKAYAPIGLCLGGDSSFDIALSIFSEIMLIKNNGKLKHMREI